MKLRDVYERIDALYPKQLSDEYVARYNGHDNSGILLMDEKEEVTGALFSLDLSAGAIAAAKARGMNLIVTHHPAIFFPVANLLADDPLGARLLRAVGAGIGVISMHLNFDAAPFGIDWHLMRGLGGKCEEAVMCPLEGGGYGRLYDVEGQPFADFCAHVKEEFASRRCVFYDSGRQVKKVASFCGAGCDEQSVAFAIAGGADTFVSSDFKHHHIAALVNAGINIVSLTHYASEIYGFARIYASLKERLSIPSALFIEKIFL